MQYKQTCVGPLFEAKQLPCSFTAYKIFLHHGAGYLAHCWTSLLLRILARYYNRYEYAFKTMHFSLPQLHNIYCSRPCVTFNNLMRYSELEIIYFSQKQLSRKIKSRLLIMMCAGYRNNSCDKLICNDIYT